MHTIKKLKRTIVFILKLALFASLFGIFFGIFGISNPWLFNLSRTTGVTMVTFAALGIALMQVYGGYAIGTAKNPAHCPLYGAGHHHHRFRSPTCSSPL